MNREMCWFAVFSSRNRLLCTVAINASVASAVHDTLCKKTVNV